jgi:hypothetical protein
MISNSAIQTLVGTALFVVCGSKIELQIGTVAFALTSVALSFLTAVVLTTYSIIRTFALTNSEGFYLETSLGPLGLAMTTLVVFCGRFTTAESVRLGQGVVLPFPVLPPVALFCTYWLPGAQFTLSLAGLACGYGYTSGLLRPLMPSKSLAARVEASPYMAAVKHRNGYIHAVDDDGLSSTLLPVAMVSIEALAANA